MTNRDRLQKAVDRLQQERAALLRTFEDFDQAQLDYRPRRDSWSAGQVAHHVALGEAVWQSFLKKIISDDHRDSGAVERISLDQVPFSSRVFPDFLLRSPLATGPLSFLVNFVPRPVQSMLFAVPLFKFDASARMRPTHGLLRGRLLEILRDVRQETLSLVEPRADWDLTRFRVIHPLVGSQDVYGVLELLASHEQRHSLQVNSIKKQPDFPPRQAGGAPGE